MLSKAIRPILGLSIGHQLVTTWTTRREDKAWVGRVDLANQFVGVAKPNRIKIIIKAML